MILKRRLDQKPNRLQLVQHLASKFKLKQQTKISPKSVQKVQ